ncbi:substrate-binding periplasmic protein [Nitrincola sp. MINF-07-Sa-05]|uniref:substrate-binding periplasmic protein n=1 Tax=Nitrincola salilacus TaxID=3400273 RepID=UPI003917DC05
MSLKSTRPSSWLLLLVILLIPSELLAEEPLSDEPFSEESFSEPQRVSVATLTDNPPLTFGRSDTLGLIEESIPPGEDATSLQGFSWDVLRASYHSQGYTIDLNVLPWPRAYEMVKAGSIDILFPTGFNQARAEYFYYSHHPINEVRFIIYTLPEKQIEWDGLKSLEGQTIGMLRGWNYGLEWDGSDQIDKFPLSDILQAFMMLDLGRIDGLAGYETNFDYALDHAGKPNIYTKHPSFGRTMEFAAASQQNPNARHLLEVFDRGMDYLRTSGELDRIKTQWFPDSMSSQTLVSNEEALID